jgi:hypothetical protein
MSKDKRNIFPQDGLDPLEEITKSMTYTIPQIDDNVIKNAKLIRICKTRGCAKPVFVSKVYARSGRIDYCCPDHGKRNFAQMDWMDITGSTMIVFRKVGLH